VSSERNCQVESVFGQRKEKRSIYIYIYIYIYIRVKGNQNCCISTVIGSATSNNVSVSSPCNRCRRQIKSQAEKSDKVSECWQDEWSVNRGSCLVHIVLINYDELIKNNFYCHNIISAQVLTNNLKSNVFFTRDLKYLILIFRANIS